MIYYPEDKKSFKQLVAAADSAYSSCSKLRDTRVAAVKEYVGKHYAENGSDHSNPINMLEFAVSTYVRQLAAAKPQVLVNSKFPELRPAAGMFEAALNQLLTEIDAAGTFRRAVLDAMFGVGIIKVGISEDARHEIMGNTHVVGVPFMDCIDLEDMFFDTKAVRFDQQSFIGHTYTMPKELALESALFDKNIEEQIGEYAQKMYTQHGDRLSDLFGSKEGQLQSADDVQDITILELWLPHTDQIVSMLVDPFTRKICSEMPIRMDEWTGAACGPYHMLGFIDVPGQLLPTNPVAYWLDPHKFMNASYRKFIRQSARQKDVMTYAGEDEDDVRRITMAEDGQVVKSQNPQAVQVSKFGGVDEKNLGFMMQVKQTFSELAGNLDSLGGIAPSANTVGQENMLSEASNRRVQEMQDRVISFSTDCIRQLGAMLWESPGQALLIQRKFEYQGQIMLEQGMSWPNPGVEGYPDDLREGPFENYDLNIEPFSMSHSSPAEKLEAINGTLQNLLLPAQQQLAEQGLYVDLRRVVELQSHLMGLPELKEVVLAQDPTFQQPADGERPGQPSFTGGDREVNHRYNGIRDRRSTEQNNIDSLMKGSSSDGNAN